MPAQSGRKQAAGPAWPGMASPLGADFSVTKASCWGTALCVRLLHQSIGHQSSAQQLSAQFGRLRNSGSLQRSWAPTTPAAADRRPVCCPPGRHASDSLRAPLQRAAARRSMAKGGKKQGKARHALGPVGGVVKVKKKTKKSKQGSGADEAQAPAAVQHERPPERLRRFGTGDACCSCVVLGIGLA